MGGRGSAGGSGGSNGRLGDKPGEEMVTLYHRTMHLEADQILADKKFKPGGYTRGHVFFGTDRNDPRLKGWGSQVVSVKVPKRVVLKDEHPDLAGSSAVKVHKKHLRGRKITRLK